MSDVQYLKCACKECGNGIEFPADAAGTTVACPHCGQWTELLAPKPEPKPSTFPVALLLQAITLGMVIAVIAGAIWYWRHHHPSPQANTETIPPKGATTAQKSAPGTIPPGQTVAETNTIPREKSPDDLKVGDIQLEKTKGSSLVYAIGTVKNDSAFDRYGLRIELDVFNGKGTKIAGAKDYKDYLAPHQDWHFHALIPDPKAATAKVASLKEDQ